jgi:hypothetical protein
MGTGAQGLLAFVALATALGCGQTIDNSRSNGQGGGAAIGGSAEQVAGGAANVGSAGAFGGSLAGQGGTNGGTAGGTNGGAGAAGAACTPAAHTRPTPGTLSQSFADLGGSLAGVYLIDSLFDQAQDCTAMCSLGNAFGAPSFAYHYISVQAQSGGDLLDITACETAAACADSTAQHFAIGTVDTAKSDQILSAQRTKVETPQGQACEGATVDTWLIQTAPSKIRVDVQNVNVTFSAVYDQQSGLWGCDAGDAESAAFGQACNSLTVVDATRVQ